MPFHSVATIWSTSLFPKFTLISNCRNTLLSLKLTKNINSRQKKSKYIYSEAVGRHHEHCVLAWYIALPQCACQWSSSNSCKMKSGSVVFWQKESLVQEASVHTELSVCIFVAKKVGSRNWPATTYRRCCWINCNIGLVVYFWFSKRLITFLNNIEAISYSASASTWPLCVCGDSRLQLSVLVVCVSH